MSYDHEIIHGTYTPTWTLVSNLVANPDTYICNYVRVKNMVTVTGRVDIDPVSINTLTVASVSIPFELEFVAETDASGVAGMRAGAAYSGAMYAMAGQDQVRISFQTMTEVGRRAWDFSFTYRIV